MILKRNDKGEFEEVNVAHVTPELLILSKLESIEEKIQLISSKLDLEEKDNERYSYLKTDYEARLKADMVVMLEEIQLGIEEQKRDELSYQQTWNHPLNVCISIIQQKIDKVKEQTGEKE